MNLIDFSFPYETRTYTLSTVFEKEFIFEKIRRTGTFYELKLLKVIASLGLSGVYVDVGANIGNHTVFFLNECPSTEVISIEPEPTLYTLLDFNILQNKIDKKPYTTWACAVGDKECFISLITDTHNMGSTSVDKNSLEGRIPCRTLDSLVSSKDVVLLKLDTEGYEDRVLLGATQLLKRCSPVVVCETTTEEDFQRIDSFLRDFGYNTDRVCLAATPTYLWTPKGFILNHEQG